MACKGSEGVLWSTGPNLLYHRDDEVDRPRAMGALTSLQSRSMLAESRSLTGSEQVMFFGKRNGSRTCLVQICGRAGTNLGRDGLR